MKKDYYIIGSGGFAKEVYALTLQALKTSNQFKGFIDIDPSKSIIKVGNLNLPVINQTDFLETVSPSEKIELYIGVGNPQIINKISKLFTSYNFPNLIHPNVIYDSNLVELGIGNILTAGCILPADISIGSFNIFNLSTTLAHDIVIGNCNVFNPGVNVSGAVIIGSSNLFGTNSTVLQTLAISDNNVIGASALLTKNVKSNSTMVGIPARNVNDVNQ